MEPFQVNCSELIADFQVEADEDVREIVKLLVEFYKVNLYFEFSFWSFKTEKFCFKSNRDFVLEVDGISFEVSIGFDDYNEEVWIARLVNSSNLTKLIEGIEKIKILSYGEESLIASHPLARALRDQIIARLPNYQAELEKKLLGEVNLDELIEFELKLVSGENETRLAYGANGYEDSLGWYFDAGEHYRVENYPFFEWAEKECQALIRPFDGGSSFGYEKFLQDEQRKRLESKR